MTRRTLLWVPFAARLSADIADEIRTLLNSALEGLRTRNEARFLAAFDPAMKGYRELRDAIHALLQLADLDAYVEIAPTQLTWSLDVTAHDLAAGTTHRKVQTPYTTNRSGGQLHIASLEFGSLFAPPHGREAWDTLSGVAMSLQLASRAADGREENDIPTLLAFFDRSMQGYNQLASDVKALTSAWLVEPAIQLTSNEGDDNRRTVESDWSLTLTNPIDAGSSIRREEHVKCVVEKRGKQWLIVSFEPLSILALPQA